jgi:hypothetical protein
MTPEQFCKLLEYIKKNNSWGEHMYEINHIRHRRAIKCIDSCFDSRDGRVWSITFRGVTHGDYEVSFRIECQRDIDNLYKWLDKKVS